MPPSAPNPGIRFLDFNSILSYFNLIRMQCATCPTPIIEWQRPTEHCAVLCCAVLCWVVLCYTVICCAIACCVVLRCVVPCCTVLCCAMQCCAVLHVCVVLCYAALCCARLCCVVLCYTVPCCAVPCHSPITLIPLNIIVTGFDSESHQFEFAGSH